MKFRKKRDREVGKRRLRVKDIRKGEVEVYTHVRGETERTYKRKEEEMKGEWRAVFGSLGSQTNSSRRPQSPRGLREPSLGSRIRYFVMGGAYLSPYLRHRSSFLLNGRPDTNVHQVVSTSRDASFGMITRRSKPTRQNYSQLTNEEVIQLRIIS